RAEVDDGRAAELRVEIGLFRFQLLRGGVQTVVVIREPREWNRAVRDENNPAVAGSGPVAPYVSLLMDQGADHPLDDFPLLHTWTWLCGQRPCEQKDDRDTRQ